MTVSFEITDWMRDELERRKDLIRRLWAGEPVERVPLDVRVAVPSRYSLREQYFDVQKQLETALTSAIGTWTMAPSSDAVPAMRPEVGCSCLASSFGVEYYWGDSEDQTPGVKDRLITDLQNQVDGLPDPDPYADGWIPEGLRRIRIFVDATEGFVPVSLLDAAGGLNVASDLMGMTEMLIALSTCPDAVHKLLDKIQRLFLATIRAGIEMAGGQEYITTTDFPDQWFPEGWKGHVSDDISAMISPSMYREFCAPYHAMVFEQYGCGGLHNCGPNPCAAEYVAHSLSPRAIDLSDTYSHDDLPMLRRALKRKALVYLSWGGTGTPIQWYAEIMELMSPDVIVVPIFHFRPEDDPEALCRELRPVAEEYAKRMDWGWDDPPEQSR